MPPAVTTVRARSVAFAGAVSLLVVACNDTPPRTAEAYCATVAENLDTLNTPAIATTLDIDDTIAVYRLIADRAPVAVEPEWGVLVANLETAATVVPTDAQSVQRAADTARAAQPAAMRVQDYTVATCALQIGTPPAATAPAVTSTSVEPPAASG